MSITAPCYSKKDYYDFFDIDFKNMKVLDIGASVGSFKKSSKFRDTEKELSSAEEYVSLDINPDSGADIIADAHTLPFPDRKFDIIIANNVIEHFYSPTQAVSEMLRVLKKGGVLYFTIPFLYPVHESPHDYVRFTRYGLEKLFADFNGLKIYSRGGIVSTIASYVYISTRVLDKFKLGEVVRYLLYPFFWILVQFDRLDNSGAFVRTYFGRCKK